ncbi:protoporphyrinogen oxidase [Paenibacillus sp. P96]|uniref:Coproporphyrinogen III oxidase n=1 Tax=Paenibacillus zeirhizosphaerae TaxID=2987519 RepID=A0ABT9FLH3_9BACL|nr:protoporphyrinogen oxidase [Paenibacillus sp. P96]MDP4095583.1 protoporphyrinogen oxidase [Paenibacillus sp. P96]
MKTVVVIGGGITGLTAMYTLQKAMKEQNQRLKLMLVEADEMLGGKIRTVRQDDFMMETGADSIVARKNDSALMEELGLAGEIVYNATGRSFIYLDGGLKKIPADAVFGIPVSLQALAESELISAEGKVAALKDYYTPNETFTENDSLGVFLEHFLGEELVRKQISPVISGVYSGELDNLTIASTFPFLLEYKNKYGSIMKGLAENRDRFLRKDGRKFVSFRRGVSDLIDRLEARLNNVEILKGTQALSVTKTRERYEVALTGGRILEADFVVLSTAHTSARSLLQDEGLNRDFDRLSSRSLISVYLGYNVPDERLPEDGTGFIAAPNSGLMCDASTWTSRKWQHTSARQQLLIRMFYKSSNPHFDKLQQMTEEELISVAVSDVEKSIGITDRHVTCDVTKWRDSIPNYHLGHPDIVRSLESKLAASHPGVFLAGCSYYGVGIPDCIANGVQTGQKIVDALVADNGSK